MKPTRVLYSSKICDSCKTQNTSVRKTIIRTREENAPHGAVYEMRLCFTCQDDLRVRDNYSRPDLASYMLRFAAFEVAKAPYKTPRGRPAGHDDEPRYNAYAMARN